MRVSKYLLVGAVSLALSGCVEEGSYGNMLTAGLSAIQASMLDENDVKKSAHLSSIELDKQNKVAPSSSQYAKRLARITKGLENVDGLNINYKVYLDESVNAFAMADGTVRVHSGLLDAMPDDQVLAVIGHEIGHVKLKHSYKQMKQEMLTNAAFQAAGASSGALGDLSNSQLGALANNAINAKYSQSDELQADNYALTFLESKGKQPSSMLDAINTLKRKYGNNASFLSSHPSNQERIDAIQSAL